MSLHDSIEAIVRGRHSDPFNTLGMHEIDTDTFVVNVFVPDADAVSVVECKPPHKVHEMERLHPDGFYQTQIRACTRFRYQLRVQRADDIEEIEDPYRFPPLLNQDDIWLLSEGTHQKLWEVLGAHISYVDGVEGTRFAVWAPNARRVSVICDANDWDARRHPMRFRSECGIWELFLPGVTADNRYKYDILGKDGYSKKKADPFAFFAETRPATASIVTAEPEFVEPDTEGLVARNRPRAPISIYEVHLGSWRRKVEWSNCFLSWDDLIDQLVPYVKDMQFTHVEFLPVSEFPFDGSWGYQPLGLYAPSSRFGAPPGFRRLVEAFHNDNIGVILDWVPGHFPSDDFGLARFDGSRLYEHADPRQGYHPDWNTLIYNFGRNEVRNFLSANALYWLECFGVDGLRVDAVASLLYLNYSRAENAWVPNAYGGQENLEAIHFLKETNDVIHVRRPGSVTIAEESTAWPRVSHPSLNGGLGFNYKWNMGWMHDTLKYIKQDPVHRKYHHNHMTFGMLYAYEESFVLPLSHDEVVHGKGSLLRKMPGDQWQKFANLRAYFSYMFGHPGKKLLFMGGEFAQDAEWDHDQSLDWHLLNDPLHLGIQNIVRDLNRMYRERPALHELDCDPLGFEWIVADDADNSVFAFMRRDACQQDLIIVVVNFTPVQRYDYRIGVPVGGSYTELLNSDAAIYGGSNRGNAGQLEADTLASHCRPFSLSLTLPPLGALYLAPTGVGT